MKMIANERTAAIIQLLALAGDASRPWIGDNGPSGDIDGRCGFGDGDAGIAVVAIGDSVGFPSDEVLPPVGTAVGSGAVVTGATGLLVSDVTGAPLLLPAEGIAVSGGAVVTGVTGPLV